MGYGLGVDLGTTFTAAAVSDSSGTRAVPLGENMTVSSVVFASEDGTLLTGDAAEKAAAKDPSRASYAHKRRLGDPTQRTLGNIAYSPASLMAAQLRAVMKSVTALKGAPPDTVVLTCPAVWGPYRCEHFQEVPRLAGLRNARVITEPEAAATHYAMERRLGINDLVAVYDLGGGTFDTTVLRALPSGMEILGTPEGIERMGGIDFDQTLFAYVDDELDGAISDLDPADPEQALLLADIHHRCVRAKEELSTEPDVKIRVLLPDGERDVDLSRLKFNDLIRPLLHPTVEALERTLNSARVRIPDLAGVLLAGGSSRMPLVSQVVSAAFGKPVHVTLHPKLTVALGAAAVARNDMLRAAQPPPPRQPVKTEITASNGGSTNVATLQASGPNRSAGQQSAFPPPKFLVPPPSPGKPHQPTGSPVRPAAPARRKTGGQQTAVAVTAAAVVVMALVAGVVALVSSGGDPTDFARAQSASPSATQTGKGQPPQVVTDFFNSGSDVGPFESHIAAEVNWEGVEVPAAGSASLGPISITPGDVNGKGDGRHVSWNGQQAGQYYLQSPNHTTDIRPFLPDGVLAFDITVQQEPSAEVTLAAHCRYPCAAEMKMTQLVKKLSPNQKATMRIPLSCFQDRGLDPSAVDTPFLVLTTGTFKASFAHVRWEKGLDEAVSCGEVR